MVKEEVTKGGTELQAPRGMEDILPHQWALWRRFEKVARETFELNGYREIRTPVFEDTRLFVRGIGDSTDIVEKEMYTFADTEDSSITLRPENTAGVMRAYVEYELYKKQKFQKFYYAGPQFRKERPQAGRLRQFHQIGIEAVGSPDPLVDAETISVAAQVYKRLELTGYQIKLNSIGCEKCRPGYREVLRKELSRSENRGRLCEFCVHRLERNVLRVLDCKNQTCRDVSHGMPEITNFLCGDCNRHFQGVVEALVAINVNYELDRFLVRGLDYYTKTVYEIIHPSLGARSAICAGGRYDNLISEIGGPPTGAVGFAMGVESSLLALENVLKGSLSKDEGEPPTAVYIISIGEEARREGFKIASRLRAQGLSCDLDYEGRSPKAQMRMANKLGVKKVILIGPEELEKKLLKLKDMATGQETLVREEDVLQSGVRSA